jgi:NAD-dependent dihydropyrimidine dehydrogenase PreA subunit
MIELVHAGRCIECDICVRICPRDVFDAVADDVPVIARKGDCQTCFLCEIYCPVDALYVSPRVTQDEAVDPVALEQDGTLGSYARALGWKRGRAAGTDQDTTRHLRLLGGVGG